MDFKETINIEEKNPDKIDEYSLLKFGDIIWAKRYSNEEEMLEIPEGHKEGPFIVIDKDNNNNLICLQCSGTPPKSPNAGYRTIILDNQVYPFNKITYVHVARNNLVEKDMFIKKNSSLTEEDKRNLSKKIGIINDEGMYVDIKINIPEIPLEIGDIFYDGLNINLIIAETENEFIYISLLRNNNKDNHFIELDGKKYYLNFNNIKQCSKLLDLKRYNFIDKYNLKKILYLQKEMLEYLRRKTSISRGNLIKLNNTYYYIYGEIGNEWMAFRILPFNRNLCHIVIDNKDYYTNFSDDIRIPKNIKDIEIIAVSTETEMKTIKDAKKSYMKQKPTKKTSFSIIKEDIQPGSVVKICDKISPNLYIIILRSDNEVVTINYTDYKRGNYVLNKFYVQHLKKLGDVEEFDLKQILYDIKDISDGYINKKRLKKIIKELEI